ncbi:MAG: hypothetical protein AUG09_06340 [Acidobacteria bacterium 13_1_20CM_2_68_7]|nr:MAG: hypothetical protein AUG09_06340 [Acidobacteria bacterium 13_1_20CM_2_68_7]
MLEANLQADVVSLDGNSKNPATRFWGLDGFTAIPGSVWLIPEDWSAMTRPSGPKVMFLGPLAGARD